MTVPVTLLSVVILVYLIGYKIHANEPNEFMMEFIVYFGIYLSIHLRNCVVTRSEGKSHQHTFSRNLGDPIWDIVNFFFFSSEIGI